MAEGEWGRVLTAAEITESFVEEFHDRCVDGWNEDRIDWEEAIERWEDYHKDEGVTFGSEWDSPAIRKLKRLVRAIHAECM